MWGGDLSLTVYLCFGRGVSQSYSNQRDKTMAKLTKLAVNHRRFDGRAPDSPAPLSNQVNGFCLYIIRAINYVVYSENEKGNKQS